MVRIQQKYKSSLSVLLWHHVVRDIDKYPYLFPFISEVSSKGHMFELSILSGLLRLRCEVCSCSHQVTVQGRVEGHKVVFFVVWDFVQIAEGSELCLSLYIQGGPAYAVRMLEKMCVISVFGAFESQCFSKLYAVC